MGTMFGKTIDNARETLGDTFKPLTTALYVIAGLLATILLALVTRAH